MKRNEAREKVFAVLFQYEFHDDFAQRWPQLLTEAGLKGAQGEYAAQTVSGILGKLTEIDSIIASRLKGWTTDRISKPAITLLRLGVFELLFNPQIPDVSAIDEAVRLSHVYCETKEADFINGLLDGLYKGSAGRRRPVAGSREV